MVTEHRVIFLHLSATVTQVEETKMYLKWLPNRYPAIQARPIRYGEDTLGQSYPQYPFQWQCLLRKMGISSDPEPHRFRVFSVACHRAALSGRQLNHLWLNTNRCASAKSVGVDLDQYLDTFRDLDSHIP